MHVGALVLHTSNVSATGVQLVCPVPSLPALRRALDGGRIDAEIALPEGGRVGVRGRLAYISEHDDEYLVGVHLEAFRDDGRARWEVYLGGQADRVTTR